MQLSRDPGPPPLIVFPVCLTSSSSRYAFEPGSRSCIVLASFIVFPVCLTLSSSRYAFEPGSIVFCLFIVSLECSNRGPSGFVFRVLLRLQALKQKPLDTRYRHSGTTGILNLRGLWPQFSAMRSEQIHQRRMSRILRSQRLQILRSYDRLTTFDYV